MSGSYEIRYVYVRLNCIAVAPSLSTDPDSLIHHSINPTQVACSSITVVLSSMAAAAAAAESFIIPDELSLGIK